MQFLKSNKIYAIVKKDNILGIYFTDPNSSETNLEVIEWNYSELDKSKVQTSQEKVVGQVLYGLDWANKELGTNYKLSKIYFSAYDSSANRVYSGLISVLISHYHRGNEFKEVKLLDL